ncbi:alanine racemase [Desulfobulbus propionicus DSM 2032]|uniref:Alanine racemase n=1 Tax=Desulfobulbus propionicus (strain ATCC 33891 / DSM 2032 / VKM B-1956 / 1pr3) TaxID=577650 RepID=A0A7U3YMG2_DESPD|nr:alanine racemase [Desulfobulbus propionicus]ADW18093.1 alanine racemase [Desulfobulbus propionicus DSM 2032]
MRSLNRVEVSRSALIHNFGICRQWADGAAIMPLVKADGYGHGMIDCARVFAEQGAAAFGVAEAIEGVRLRAAGITQPILVLAGVIPQTLPTMVEADLTPVVVDAAIVPELSRLAGLQRREIGVHVKLDAGMGRQGVLPEDFVDLVRTVRGAPHLRLDGVMAHFPCSDEPQSANSAQVLRTFTATTASLAALTGGGCCLHLANSGGLFYVAGARLDMVRPGIALYGYYPDGETGRAAAAPPLLRPAMRFATRIIQVRRVPAGSGLGYSHLFTTSRPSTIAVLPVGYDDGYLRKLSNRAQVLIHGRRVPTVGRISMNLTLVDVTGIDGVQVGDEAVLLGRQGEETITADEIAAWMETISYEVLCLFGKLNDREMID